MALFIVPYIGSLTMISSSCIFLSNFLILSLKLILPPPPPPRHACTAFSACAQCKLKVIGATNSLNHANHTGMTEKNFICPRFLRPRVGIKQYYLYQSVSCVNQKPEFGAFSVYYDVSRCYHFIVYPRENLLF